MSIGTFLVGYLVSAIVIAGLILCCCAAGKRADRQMGLEF